MEIIKPEVLLEELQKIDERVQLVPNPNRPGISNFKIGPRDIAPPVPTNGLQTEITPGYSYQFPNGMVGQFATYDHVRDHAIGLLNKLKDPKFSADFFEEI